MNSSTARITDVDSRPVLSSRRRVAVVLVGAALCLSLVAIGLGIGSASADATDVAASTGATDTSAVYVVQSGDTLWGIAQILAPNADTPRVVAALRKAAGGSSLQPGQRIVLPASLR